MTSKVKRQARAKLDKIWKDMVKEARELRPDHNPPMTKETFKEDWKEFAKDHVSDEDVDEVLEDFEIWLAFRYQGKWFRTQYTPRDRYCDVCDLVLPPGKSCKCDKVLAS